STQVSNKLRIRPNPYMTPTTFWATIEFYRNHYGNAYVWARWYKGDLIDLWILPFNNVTVVLDDAGLFGTTYDLYYKYRDHITNKEYVFNHKEILHFKTSISRDG